MAWPAWKRGYPLGRHLKDEGFRLPPLTQLSSIDAKPAQCAACRCSVVARKSGSCLTADNASACLLRLRLDRRLRKCAGDAGSARVAPISIAVLGTCLVAALCALSSSDAGLGRRPKRRVVALELMKLAVARKARDGLLRCILLVTLLAAAAAASPTPSNPDTASHTAPDNGR